MRNTSKWCVVAMSTAALLLLAGCEKSPTAVSDPGSHAPGALAQLATLASTPTPTDVTYGMLHGTFRFWETSFTAVSDGYISGNTAIVSPGALLSLTGNWQVGPVTDITYCPYCIIELYLAWVPPATAEGAGPTNKCLWTGITYFLNPDPGDAGSLDWTTQAPTTPGTYYLGGAQTLEYSCIGTTQGDVGWPTGAPGTEAASFMVVVNGPPVANAGADVTVECAGSEGTEVTLDGSASSDPDNNIQSYEWFEGATSLGTGVTLDYTFSLGSHTVTLVVTDEFGETGSDDVVVDVIDTTPPVLEFALLEDVLWPPNHKMVLVASGISASDVCCEVTTVVEVTSNEPENGTGDGDTEPDWEVVDNGDGTYDVWVRAERAGTGTDRVYTITATATDCAGNSTSASGVVTVPHDKGK